MKKLILSAFMLLGLAFSKQAQDISKNALGLRLGDNDGFGGEISYQRGLGKNNPENGKWNLGDDYTTDPPQEPQGLNSVFSTDKTTLDLIKKYNNQLKNLK